MCSIKSTERRVAGLVGTGSALGGPTMFARIGVMRHALNRDHRPALEPRRKRAKRYRVIP
jgi:hypothetical protein